MAEPREVLYIDLEDSRRSTKERLRTLLGNRRDPNLANLHVVRRWPVGEMAVEKLDEWLSEHPNTRIVVIDTLVGIRKERRKNQDLYDYDYKVIAGFRELADRYGIAIVIVHHFNKSRLVGDVFDKFSGSSGIQAAPHSLIAYSAKRGERGGIMEVTGKRSSEVTFALKRDAKERPIWQDAGEFQTSKERLAIIMELREAYPTTLSCGDLAELLEAKKATISKRLAAMVRASQIIREGDGNRSRYRAVRGTTQRRDQNHEQECEDNAQQEPCGEEIPDF
jgi:DNA-binding MarR family transcriptional regulator